MRTLILFLLIPFYSSIALGQQTDIQYPDGLYYFDDSTYSTKGVHLYHLLYFDGENQLVYDHHDQLHLFEQVEPMRTFILSNSSSEPYYYTGQELSFNFTYDYGIGKFVKMYSGTYDGQQLIISVTTDAQELTIPRKDERVYLQVGE